MELADHIWGNDEIIRKVTESLLRYAELCIENDGVILNTMQCNVTKNLCACIIIWIKSEFLSLML
jgi:hypothetical protein